MGSADVQTPRLGIDFDNTIVSYAGLFEKATDALGLRRPEDVQSKGQIRTWLRSLPGGEEQWQKAQARVYGDLIREATEIAGFKPFIGACRERGWPVRVVSHKTEFSEQDRSVNLRDAAVGWMEAHGFFDELGFHRSDISFCSTREEKLLKIRSLNCTLFVDDLVEVLLNPKFPEGVERILMAPESSPTGAGALKAVKSWTEVGDIVFA